jgi:hypothetical protein
MFDDGIPAFPPACDADVCRSVRPTRKETPMRIALFLLLLLKATVAHADECRFDYWQVIPADTPCDTFRLPDFEFRKVVIPPDAPGYNRFCQHFEVVAGTNTQKVGYCYTGLGDRFGPRFKVGEKSFMADTGFRGCLNDQPVQGIVFVSGEWSEAPKHLRRLLPVQALPRKASCR